MLLGPSGFLFQLAMFIVPVGFFLVGRSFLTAADPEQKKRFRKPGYLVVAISCLLSVVIGIKFGFEISGHIFLQNLSVENVASMRIGEIEITDPAQINTISSALKNSSWFAQNKERWINEIPFEVRMRSGASKRFTLAMLEHDQRTIRIKFYPQWNLNCGAAVSDKLIDALTEMGIHITRAPQQGK